MSVGDSEWHRGWREGYQDAAAGERAAWSLPSHGDPYVAGYLQGYASRLKKESAR